MPSAFHCLKRANQSDLSLQQDNVNNTYHGEHPLELWIRNAEF
jgi:hypothetical protein